ncbi:bacteriocin [Pediococcus ethanolidurans]|uniref:leucocin A/sakacin P family class II bacteriocin n=1 Tax=Pediococcus ethanolidurans TaxID=319653 RepID=UPI00288BAB65|nr:leucocin A/sakacin P family class II bacteriocin [Pediococcus ethanolidurans]MCT4398389.1 bacteriocin [Pediococcus ethanolidurans]
MNQSQGQNYYGDGIFCTKHGCSINWNKAFYCGVNRVVGVYGTSGQATIGSC